MSQVSIVETFRGREPRFRLGVSQEVVAVERVRDIFKSRRCLDLDSWPGQ